MNDEQDSKDERLRRERDGSRGTLFLMFLSFGLFLLIALFGADSWAFYLGSWCVVGAAWYLSGLN
jgi:hypothetical protein